MKTVFRDLQRAFARTRQLGRHSAKGLIFIIIVLAITSAYSFAVTDVLFLIDTTSSMEGLENFKTLLNEIAAAVNTDVPCAYSVLYGVADYRNYADEGNYQAYGVNLVQPFTSNLLAALSAVAGLSTKVGAGGDEPESQLKAMVTITENWVTTRGDVGFNGRAEAQKILIWSGDAPGHIAGDEPGSIGSPPDGYYPTLDAAIEALTNQNIMVFALNGSNEDAGLNEPYAGVRDDIPPARQQASEITAATGGALFNNVGAGGSVIEHAIVGAITCLEKHDDLDDDDPLDCRSPGETITYTICWDNAGGTTLEDAYIVDFLPPQVSYPGASWQFELDPNFQPPFVLYPPDPAYVAGEYVWPLGDIDPNTSGCVEISVVVNTEAAPGMYLHNVIELHHLVYDANGLNPVDKVATAAAEDTLICCWPAPPVVYVDAQAIGNNTGMDWQNACVDLHDALTRTGRCPQDYVVYVAEGEYASEPNGFELIDDMQLYGGFPTGGCEFSRRNPEQYTTILTGRIDETHRNDTVVTMADNTLLDGFTITDAAIHGVYGEGVDFSLVRCTITNSWRYGLEAIDGNVSVEWCTIRSNYYDGILHEGEGYTLDVANTWCRQNGRCGLRCTGSTPSVKNSIISESDMAEAGNEGILMVNPTSSPVLQNLTVAHNKALGLALAGTNVPVLDNLIVYFNNAGGDQFSGFGRDSFYYSCVYDLNDPNGVDLTLDENSNFSADPQLITLDPNNIRISAVSPCRDASDPALNYERQWDMDGRPRVMEATADIGAYEVNLYDLDADGRVNLYEFGVLASVWQAHDPDDPQSAGVPAENLALWNFDAERCNFSVEGASQYAIDLGDLTSFVEGAPWPLAPGFVQEGGVGEIMLLGGEGMLVTGFETMSPTTQAVPEESTLEHLGDLVNIIGQLETIWFTDPDIQEEVDAADWQQFMEALYGNLIEVYMSTR